MKPKKYLDMKKINYKGILLLLFVVGFSHSCKDEFLEVEPNAALNETVISTPEGVNALLIGAYSMLDGVSGQGFGWEAASSNWVYGSIRGMEANKGTDSGDQPDINPLQTYSENSSNPYLNLKWRSVYEAVARCNSALKILAKVEEEGNIEAALAESYRNQARVLRGWYHFEAWRM